MDVMKILSDVKGKVLDSAHFDLLEHAYNLQSENIRQLKTNNAALKESEGIQVLKVAKLEQQNGELTAANAELTEQVRALQPQATPQLNEVAQAIIKLCFKNDLVRFSTIQLLQGLPYSQIAVDSALEQLEQLGLILLGSYIPDEGNYYRLTSEGKSHILDAGAAGQL